MGETGDAIRKVKFKDYLTQIIGPYCTPCVEVAQRENLRLYMEHSSSWD